MKTLLTGECRSENILSLLDPSAFTEIAFEAEVVKALCCLYPSYRCGVFKGSFKFSGERRSADLALIHKRLSHWFVIEVELASHSLDRHVVPQVRCFRFGDPEPACVTSLCSGFPDLSRTEAENLIRYVPLHVAVIANRLDPHWQAVLSGLDVQLLSVSVFEGQGGKRAHEIEGQLFVQQENLGFATYLATDKSLRITRTCGLPTGALRIEDQFGVPSTWTARDDGSALWITKDEGDPVLPNGEFIQIVRSYDGRISLRLRI